jgi:hypothetical protein
MAGEPTRPDEALIRWINTHDCGVTPTAVLTPDGAIEVRVQCVNAASHSESIERFIVSTYAEARDALGY